MFLEVRENLSMSMPLYRYMNYAHLVKFIKSHKYIISNIRKWEDPYENYLSKCFLIDKYNKRASRVTLEHYGQCWTKKKESDAMWRIYSTIKRSKSGKLNKKLMGIRIKSRPSQLQALPCKVSGSNRGFLGSVKYLPQQLIDSELVNLSFNSFGEYWDKWEEVFFIKRKEFEHEKEFRMVFSCGVNAEKVIATICPFDFIQEIVFDPRLTIVEYDEFRSELLELDFPASKIKLSQLYHFNAPTIKIMV